MKIVFYENEGGVKSQGFCKAVRSAAVMLYAAKLPIFMQITPVMRTRMPIGTVAGIGEKAASTFVMRAARRSRVYGFELKDTRELQPRTADFAALEEGGCVRCRGGGDLERGRGSREATSGKARRERETRLPEKRPPRIPEIDGDVCPRLGGGTGPRRLAARLPVHSAAPVRRTTRGEIEIPTPLPATDRGGGEGE